MVPGGWVSCEGGLMRHSTFSIQLFLRDKERVSRVGEGSHSNQGHKTTIIRHFRSSCMLFLSISKGVNLGFISVSSRS